MNNVIFFIVIDGMKVCVNLCINVIRRSLNSLNNQNNQNYQNYQRTPSIQSLQSIQITPSIQTIPITPTTPPSFYQLSSLQDSGGTAADYHLSLCP